MLTSMGWRVVLSDVDGADMVAMEKRVSLGRW